MYEKVMAQWVPNFLYASVGFKSQNVAINVGDYAPMFNSLFIEPAQKLYGKKELSEVELATLIKAINASGLKCWYRTFAHVIENNLTSGSDVTDTVVKSVANFEKSVTAVYAMCMGGKTFTTYADNNELIGAYTEKVCILGPCSKFKKYAPEIKELIRKDPWTLPDPALMAIRNAVAAEIVTETALRGVVHPIPDYSVGKIANVRINALSDMPGYFVRRLISNIPEATANDATSPYHAALEFAYTDPENYRSAINELEDILNKLGDDTMQITPAEVEQRSNGVDISGLNRDNVMEWLHVTYGISYDNLNAILIPTVSKQYNSPLLASDKLSDMSAEQLMESMTDENTGYLDDLVKAYCHEVGMSTACTIDQLLESINEDGSKKEPISIFDAVADYVATNNVSNDLTVEEFCAQIPHTPTDKLSVTMDTLNECPGIDDELCDLIAEALEEQLTMSENPPKKLKPIKVVNQDNVMEFLVNNGVEPELANAIIVDHSTVKDIAMAYAATNPDELSVKSEPTKEELITYITRIGLPRSVATSIIMSGELPDVDVSATVIKDMVKAGFDEKAATDLYSMLTDKSTPVDVKTNKIVQSFGGSMEKPEQTRPSSLTSNFGYAVGEYILAETRMALQKDDTLQHHMDMRPVMGCFIRLLMCFLTDKKDVLDLMKDKESEATGDAKRIISTAIKMLQN